MFDLFRLDVLLALFVIVVIIRSAFWNQRRIGVQFLTFLICLGLVGAPLLFNLGGVLDLIVAQLDAFGVVWFWNQVPEAYRTIQLTPLWLLLFTVVVTWILYLIVRLFALLFGGKERRKYKKNPHYATVHHPLLGILFGALRAMVLAYLVLLFVRFTLPLTQLDLSGDFVYQFYLQIDVVGDLISDAAAGMPFPVFGG